jgi:uncharacterized YccA/Bax inhibitor family protein
MSRNPILSDAAFGAAPPAEGRPSPADEWRNAQTMGSAGTATMAGTATTAGADAAFGTAPAPTGPIVTTGRAMTIGGVASATLVMFAVLVATAWYGWTLVTETPVLNPLPGEPTVTASIDSPLIVFGALIGAFILAMVTIFKPKLARFTGVLYAALEGVFLGAISHLYNAQFDGIVAQAILATFGVFLAMLVLYGLRILRATPRFVKGVVGATFGIMFLYLGSLIFSLFTGDSPSFLTSASPLSIGISVVIVIVAALNLILDFDFIEQGAKRGLPAYMDWYAAVGLMLTLVWLYLEMLRLLAKLRQ